MAAWRSIRIEANSEFADLSIRKLFERHPRGSFSLSTTLEDFKQTPVAIEPGVGGRAMEPGELRAGDIVLATTGNPGTHGIPSQEPISRALVCRDSQRIIDSTHQTFVETTIANVLATSQTAAVFRIQVGKDANADQRELGERLAAEASRRIGAAMSDSDKQLDRPTWVQLPQPYFSVDRYVFALGGHWGGFVHLGVPRVEKGFFPFYCSWLFLDTLDAVAKSEKVNRLFWFTVDDYTKSQTIRVFQPLGYVGHLKGPN